MKAAWERGEEVVWGEAGDVRLEDSELDTFLSFSYYQVSLIFLFQFFSISFLFWI